ncbi:uncharacterized protein DS421_5g153430 [Arachis hypogaea]|nr:uncharacterized protein DS421_5g153430 [Arachis hypogaea]
MTDRKKKGKAMGSEKRKRTSQIAETADAAFYERRISERHRVDQNTPPIDPYKFSSRYSELKFPDFLRKRSLHVERKPQIPADLQMFTKNQIAQWGWSFLDREFMAVNSSWVGSSMPTTILGPST